MLIFGKDEIMANYHNDSFLSFVVENISEGLCVCHKIEEFPYIRFTLWNKRMFELTGYTIDEINHSGWYQTVYADPDIRDKAIKRMEEMRLGDNLRDEEWEITRVDGQTRWLSISTSIIADVNNVTHVMASMIDVTERKQAESEREKMIRKLQISLDEIMRYKAKLEVMALFDSLTGLPNRRLFFDRLNMTLEHNRRHKGIFSVFFLDLDDLKTVNDTLGHEAGDEVLCAVAKRLQNVIRKSDTIARIGGDEFAIIVDQIKSAKEAKIAVEKIIASFATSIQLSASSVNVGVSIGISLFPIDSDEADELMRLADNSMYTSKSQGKNKYTFYCRDTNTKKNVYSCRGN
jgi:diguanylate cyclase (GGDEF)-like protein/PAS domain S-box-containing protein